MHWDNFQWEARQELKVDKGLQEYIEQIRSIFPKLQQEIVIKDQEEPISALSYRELEVLELLGEGLTNKEMAVKLVISLGTVKAHNIRIYRKLAVNNRRQAVEKAIKLGILGPKSII